MSDVTVRVGGQTINVALGGAQGPRGFNGPDLVELEATTGATLIGTSTGDTVEEALDARVAHCADRTALKALNVVAHSVVWLSEVGREGLFRRKTGTPPTDPLEGLYVVSNTAGFYWERQWDRIHGKPEWFGAVIGDPAVDCAPAIQACINLCPTTMLSAGQYYIGTGAAGIGANLLTISENGKRLIGAGASKSHTLTGTSAPSATEIVINSSSATGILVGHPTSPGGVAAWTESPWLEGFSVRRNVASYPLGNPVSGNADSPCGIKVWWSALPTIKNVYTFENSIGIWVTGTVVAKIVECRHERYTAGTSPGNDFFVGIYQDNSAATPYNSGNASMYVLGGGAFSNHAAGGPDYTYIAGLQSNQGFTDTYIIGFETANCGYGVDMHGRSNSAIDWQTEDLIITQCVFDGCRWDAIRVIDGGPKTAVQITNNYCGVSNATGPVSNAIQINQVHGSVQISNNQFIANVGNPARGLYVVNSSGVSANSNIITDLSIPELWDGVVWMHSANQINVSAVAPGGPAITLANCQTGKVEPRIADSSGGVTIPIGVNLSGALNAKIEVNCTGIHTPAIIGGSANKLVHNGSQITAAGAFGANCLASGIMA